METLTPVFYWLCVALGIGFVIFVHELGHFALAKWNGVKVERFSIGFGPSLLKYRRGETEYVLAALPLGGYVQMLGESPDESAEHTTDDPRAYVNKTVGARMSIICAGVVMNMIFGLACFALVYARGVEETPTRVGDVTPASPAYEAGLLPGDDIVAIDGARDLNYNQMRFKVVLSGAGQKLEFLVKRPGIEKEFPVIVEPKRDPNLPTPTIGVLSDQSLVLSARRPFQAPPGVPEPAGTEGGFQPWDKVIAVGPEGTEPTKVVDSLELRKVLTAHRDKPLVFVLERTLATGEKPSPTVAPVGPARTVKVTVAPHPMVDFGMTMTPGPIVAVQNNSPAKAAGLVAGDRIVSIDGNTGYDPMTLPDSIHDKAGTRVKLEVERDGAKRTVEVTPTNAPIWVEDTRRQPTPTVDALKVPGLGLAFKIDARIQSVAPDSPAAKAGLKAGQTINSMTYTLPKPTAEEAAEEPTAPSVTFKFGKDGPSWATAFTDLQLAKPASIEINVEGQSGPISIQPTTVPNRFFSLRGLNFLLLTRKLPPQSFTASISRGWDDTVENVVGIYLMLRGLFQRRVGTQAVGGLVRVSEMAYAQASAGLSPFLQFLGMLSINLAVLNFLPIPPLDGGQMVFLVGEKVRGRPLPDWFIKGMLVVGIVIVISLMLFANIQDIWLKIREYFS